MHVVALEIELHIPGANSLKEKRSRLKSLLARLQREFNAACVEIDLHDHHQLSIIACVTVSTTAAHAEKMVRRIPAWIERNRPDLDVVDERITHL
ncbi:MAG: DUF503 domain-containing protein [Anaerolineales bacterium]|nr:DUF503 domain-containing protein [Anaerolineales bacterium]